MHIKNEYLDLKMHDDMAVRDPNLKQMVEFDHQMVKS